MAGVKQCYEIDSAGKVIMKWNSGSGVVARIEGSRLIRKVSFPLNPSTPEDQGNAFALAIGSDHQIEVLDAIQAKETVPFVEVACPAVVKDLKSDYAYCVRDPKSKRTFVFQRPCA